jgi:hypothetical protein
MPTINPNDYNIDSFNSQNLGPITVTDFRNYILTHNLSDVEPNIASLGYTFYPRGIFSPDLWNPIPSVQDLPDLTSVSFIPSPINNNTSPRPDNLKQNLWTRQNPFYGSPTNEETFQTIAKSLEDPGSIDNWIEGNGFEVDVTTIRNMVNLSQNEYGPNYIVDYSSADAPYEVSGYEQYPSSAGGDVLGPIIGRTLGFSTNNFIDFPSELQTVARERRVEELENRIKLNFVEDTVGKINLDPLGLLGGQSLFTPNYTITRPKSFLGKAAEFTANLAGFNVPTSIIPGSKTTTQLGSNAFQDDLLDYTGKGQRDLLYANVYSSKYTPELLTTGFDPENEDSSKLLGKVGDFFRDLGKQNGDNYLKISQDTTQENQTFAQKVGNFVNDLFSPNAEKSLIPTPETDVNPSDPIVNMGLDGKYPAVDGLDDNSRFNNKDLDNPAYFIEGAEVDYYPNNTTMRPSLFDNDDVNSSFSHQTPSANALFDWRDRDRTVANRGLVKFTQDMINNAEANGHRGGAKYIGRFNSNSNLVQAEKDIGDGNVISVPKHSNVSMGNLVRDAEDDYYCRSWSTRNPYQNRYDLIRNNTLYRNKFINGMSVLEDGGHVKIAPYSNEGAAASNLQGTTFNADPEVKRYMFSIENLAWTDAPEKIGLDSCELGPNGGRIMWFPPYDINFTDNTSVSWESTVFLGRAEPIYTYNHTDRKGTLSFSVITDHPSVLNQMKERTEKEIYKFFAGCGVDITEFFEEEIEFIQRTIVEQEEVAAIEETPAPVPSPVKPPIEETPPTPKPLEPPFKEIECFFRNARRSEEVGGIRVGDGRDIDVELSIGYELDDNKPHSTDKGILNLNEPFRDKIGELIDFLATEEGQNWGVEFIGYTSGAAPKNYNKVLSIDRATSGLKYVIEKVKEKGLETTVSVGCPSGYTLSGGICYSGSTTASTITTTTGSGVFNPKNFTVGRVGYVCRENENNGNCKKATENNKLIDNLVIKEVEAPTDLSTIGRFVINAKGEDNSESPNDEDASYGNNDENFSLAKKDRKVKLKLFKNEEYIINNQVIKLEPRKLELLPVSNPTPLEPIGLTPTTPGTTKQEPEIPTIQFNDKPVTSKFGTEPGILFDIPPEVPKPKPDQNEVTLSATTGLLDIIAGTNETINSPIGDNAVDEEVKAENEVIESVVKKTVQKLFTECSYFERIKKEDPFIYETINQKIKNFHPAFHAMTPEGLNSRLTFLHQCTRQGPSIIERAGQAQNMAFGRPPICILRIGDFYYTKIVIDSMNINYEPLQWDLNPEGIGVQPQIAKVDLNFSFIGGSSIEGPIRQLQNAVSFNFFANTSVYNPRRVYNSDNGKYLTLEEKLEAEAEGLSLDGFGFTSENSVGYGSYKTPGAANTDIQQNKLVFTANEEYEQTENVSLSLAETPENERIDPGSLTGLTSTEILELGLSSEQLEELIRDGYIEDPNRFSDEYILNDFGKELDLVIEETKSLDGSTTSINVTLPEGNWAIFDIKWYVTHEAPYGGPTCTKETVFASPLISCPGEGNPFDIITLPKGIYYGCDSNSPEYTDEGDCIPLNINGEEIDCNTVINAFLGEPPYSLKMSDIGKLLEATLFNNYDGVNCFFESEEQLFVPGAIAPINLPKLKPGKYNIKMTITIDRINEDKTEEELGEDGSTGQGGKLHKFFFIKS